MKNYASKLRMNSTMKPRAQDYKVINGKRVLLGPYTIEQRSRFFRNQMELYLVRHPNKTREQAARMAMVKWRCLVASTV